MAVKKLTFDWSKLDRTSLYNILWEARFDIVEYQLTPSQFRNIINYHIKQQLPIMITKKSNFDVEPGWVYVGGCYYSDNDKQKIPCIEVNFDYNPLDEYIYIKRHRFSRMCKTFADVVLHEIIHMRQHRRRKYKSLQDYESTADVLELQKQQEYLGCKDEIDAYAFNIACELMDSMNYNKRAIVKYINKNQERKNIKSLSLKNYLRAFEYDHQHPIIVQLKRRIIRYLPYAEIGKPYSTKNWINC